jgi:hypothetical protein
LQKKAIKSYYFKSIFQNLPGGAKENYEKAEVIIIGLQAKNRKQDLLYAKQEY